MLSRTLLHSLAYIPVLGKAGKRLSQSIQGSKLRLCQFVKTTGLWVLLACNTSPSLLLESSLAGFAKVLIHCNKDTFYLTEDPVYKLFTKWTHTISLKYLHSKKEEFYLMEVTWDSVGRSHSLLCSSHQNCSWRHLKQQEQAKTKSTFTRKCVCMRVYTTNTHARAHSLSHTVFLCLLLNEQYTLKNHNILLILGQITKIFRNIPR